MARTQNRSHTLFLGNPKSLRIIVCFKETRKKEEKGNIRKKEILQTLHWFNEKMLLCMCISDAIRVVRSIHWSIQSTKSQVILASAAFILTISFFKHTSLPQLYRRAILNQWSAPLIHRALIFYKLQMCYTRALWLKDTVMKLTQPSN